MTMIVERKEVQEALSSGAVIAEVLPRAHYDAGHLPGAIHLPLEGLERFAEAIPREAPLIVYCASSTCMNSHQAADRLARAGFTNVRVYAGGKADWKAAGLEVTK